MKKIVSNKITRYIMRTFVCSLFLVCFSYNFVFADWVKENNKYKYFNSSTNSYVINNWLQTGNGYYYLDQNGYTVNGWYLINGKYYYFNQDGLMQTGFQTFNDKTYYLNPENGQMVTGWVQTYLDGIVEYLYFGADGAQVTGWQKIDNKWYYFNEGKALVDTWAKINDVWYHFNVTGAMDTGWITSNNKMYYLNVTNGALTKGWIQDQNGNEYYLSENDGSLAVNTQLMISGRYYTFDETGKCIAKDQYTGVADLYGNQAGVLAAATSGKGTGAVYGVTIGVSPGNNAIQGATTSAQHSVIDKDDLTPGSTTGPQ